MKVQLRSKSARLPRQFNAFPSVFTISLFIQTTNTYSLKALQLISTSRCLLLALACLLLTSTASAQPAITEQRALNFGTLAVPNNTSISRLSYPSSGRNINNQGQFVIIDRGTSGQYSLTGFPPFTPITVTLNNTTLYPDSIAIAEPLTVDDFDIDAPLTNSQGEATVMVGARVNTTGNGANYIDSIYSGATTMRVEYWQPDAQEFVFNSKVIDVTSELRSTIQIEQQQQLNFGTLFARTSSTAQALMTILPSGRYSINEPSDSRLVALQRPVQGMFKVSGAASFYPLSIAAQATDILLKHTEQPNAVPHFIVGNFTTSPDSVGTTDTNGELLISVGGTIKTELTGSPTVYPNGQYVGTYQLTVSY